MDPTYVQGLREAKALLDEGVLSQEEFNHEKAELVKHREDRKAHAYAIGAASSELAGGLMWLNPPGVSQPPPPPLPDSVRVTNSRKRSREDAYTVPSGMRHALKPLSKMPGRETMPDPRVRCALCTQKGSVYCLECTKAKGNGIYALCCPSSGRICACQHWSDMVSGHVATWLPYGRPAPELEGPAGSPRKPGPSGAPGAPKTGKGSGKRGRPVGWRKNKGPSVGPMDGIGAAGGGDAGPESGAAPALVSISISISICLSNFLLIYLFWISPLMRAYDALFSSVFVFVSPGVIKHNHRRCSLLAKWRCRLRARLRGRCGGGGDGIWWPGRCTVKQYQHGARRWARAVMMMMMRRRFFCLNISLRAAHRRQGSWFLSEWQASWLYVCVGAWV